MTHESEEQYNRDPAFHAVAAMAYKCVADGQLSPEELRRAVMFGVYLYEVRRTDSRYFAELEAGKDGRSHDG